MLETKEDTNPLAGHNANYRRGSIKVRRPISLASEERACSSIHSSCSPTNVDNESCAPVQSDQITFVGLGPRDPPGLLKRFLDNARTSNYSRVLARWGAESMAAGPQEMPLPADEFSSASRPGDVRRRRTRWILVITICAGLVIASVYVLSNLRAPSVLPIAWHLPDRCYQFCQFASAGGVLYTLVHLNHPYGLIANLATYFSLQAYDWSTGSVLWNVANFTVWGVGVLGVAPALFVYGGTVAVVVSGDGEWVPGQFGPPVWFGPQSSTFVFQWNATTGAFLDQNHYGAYYGGFDFWGASESLGWISAAVQPVGSSNALIQSIPMVGHSGTYEEWNATVDLGDFPSSFCAPTLRVFQVAGMVSLWVSGGQSLATLLSGSNGTELWQGEIPGWSSMATHTSGCQPENVAAGPSGQYYIGQNGSSAAIEYFDPVTQTSSTVVNLSGTNASMDGLSLLRSGELIVTDTLHDAYSAFSPVGAHLWTLGLDLTVRDYTGNVYGNVWGTVVRPVELGTNSVFLSLDFEGGSYGCGRPPCGGSIEFSLPMEIVNATTAAISWSSSYDSMLCVGGCGGGPPSYTPEIGSNSGPFLVFTVYGGDSGSCVVARFAGVS